MNFGERAATGRQAAGNVTLDAERIPVPWARIQGKSRTSKYPFGALDVGQSFFVSGGKDEQDRCVWAARAWRKLHPGARLVWERGFDGMRVWRVEPETTGS